MNIIVCREKHVTDYWDASTPEAFAASALAILTSRWNQGYWYAHPDEVFTPKYYPREIIEDVESLPESLQAEAIRQNSRAKANQREYEDALLWYIRAETLVQTQNNPPEKTRNGKYDTNEAWQLLNERSGYEYEGVDLERVRSV